MQEKTQADSRSRAHVAGLALLAAVVAVAASAAFTSSANAGVAIKNANCLGTCQVPFNPGAAADFNCYVHSGDTYPGSPVSHLTYVNVNGGSATNGGYTTAKFQDTAVGPCQAGSFTRYFGIIQPTGSARGYGLTLYSGTP